MIIDNVKHEAAAILPEVLHIRREIHRYPELGLDLPRTQKTVIDFLSGRLGLDYTRGQKLSSVSAWIEGSRPGPTVVLRADMDALPLTEDSNVPFASRTEGAMHACGHDVHTAMLLGAAAVLVQLRHRMNGRVLLMFQPGEEGQHGARLMLEEGMLSECDAAATRAFAIHIHTRYPVGTVYLRPGITLASPDMFTAEIRGRGGHASSPHLALDPIPVAAAFITAVQTMVTRQVDVFDPAVVTVAQVLSGSTHNIIPETARMQGTIRTLSRDTRSNVHALLRQVFEGTCSAHGAEGTFDIVSGYPATVNDPVVTQIVEDVARGLVGDNQVGSMPAPLMGGEDFSYVLEQVPGMMAFLGGRPAAEHPSRAPMNHSNRVVFDEGAIETGIALYASVALALLEV